MMKQFYFADADGTNQSGPLNLEQLKAQNISRETLVWFEGIENWTAAKDVEELKDFFRAIPPPLPKIPPADQTASETAYLLREDAKAKVRRRTLITGSAVVACLLVAAIVVANNSEPEINSNITETETVQEVSAEQETNSKKVVNTPPPVKYTPPPKPREKTVEELQAELYRKESRKPLRYLSETHTLSYRFLSGKDQISGEIYNTASIATFKDIVLTVIYSTETGTELYREDFVIYKYCGPNSTTPYVIKTVSPRGTRRIGVEIKEALAE